MCRIVFSVLLLVVAVYGNGELSILHHPKSLTFKGHDRLKESSLKDVFAASLGFSTDQYSNWEGLYISDPFNLARAIAAVVVDGVADIGLSKGHHIPLRTDTDELNVFVALEKQVTERYPESNNQLVRVDLGNGLEEVHNYEIFQGFKQNKLKKAVHNYLKNNNAEDREFLNEIALLSACADKIAQQSGSTNIPDVFWFKVGSLHALVDLYGENSTQVKEAKQILNDAILHLNSVFNKVYNGDALVSVITSDAVHTRRTRDVLQAKEAGPEDPDLNLAKLYTKDYPVIFNIILWFGVTMVFTLLAICLAIGSMDPGRDSIIYRMTSTRMKKDN